MERKKITFDLFIRSIVGLIVVVGFLMLLYRLSNVLVPFFLAWLIAYLMFPMVKYFQYQFRLKYRALAILAAFLFIGLIITLATLLLLPPIINEFARVKDLIVEYFNSNETASHVPAIINQFIQENIGTAQIMKLLDK